MMNMSKEEQMEALRGLSRQLRLFVTCLAPAMREAVESGRWAKGEDFDLLAWAEDFIKASPKAGSMAISLVFEMVAALDGARLTGLKRTV